MTAGSKRSGEDGSRQMTFAIFDVGMATKHKINAPEFATLDEAYAYVTDKFAKVLAFIEKDEDHEAYDFITTIGGTYAIEAVKGH
jgi:hypothetical protein